ncbi:MAG: YybH family protein [Pyrinomonadaceae bacterium]
MKLLLAVAISLCSVSGLLGQPSGEEQQVRRAVQSFYDAFNSHNFERVPEFTTEDWTHINPLGGWTRGRNAVVEELKEVHSTFLKGVTDTVEEISIRFATPDVAVVTVPSKVTTYTTPDGVKHENERQIRSFVVVKRGGKWLIMQDQNTIRR